ncbi:hypothetical protein [Methylomonas rapida]|uniref:Uncharacterized protein n=1 Tax=Methylomonas rapida TaxID=2963939 RepID=A0ABY7GNC8_9GAMM|nr:hypothetical protein [Methylomonas rapida]WAR45990.1 hypothetical protein NM686_005580 [Methylomonas rapida]
MFDDILRIFDFLSPKQTKEQYPSRKPMAIPLDSIDQATPICKKLFADLDAAEAEVLNDIDDPEIAWTLLSRIRQLRRESQHDLSALLSSDLLPTQFDQPINRNPVRIVKTQTGAQWSVFNGGQAH